MRRITVKRLRGVFLCFGLGGILLGGAAQAQTEVDCEETLAVWQVQGRGERANCYRVRVTVRGVVTLIAANKSRFFLQTPIAESDGAAETSDGLLVQTTPIRPLAELAVGDLVEVSGRVNEFYGLTQLEIAGSRRIETLARAQELPAAIDLAQVSLEWSTGAPHPLERYEGMRVFLRERAVVAPTNYFDEFGLTIDGSPAYREMGIEGDDRPDLVGMGLPEWDLNAELLEIDPPELGRPVLQLPAGVPVSVEGALSYSYLDYQIWPAQVEYDAAAVAAYAGRPVRAREVGEFTIATQNVDNLFDTVDDHARNDSRGEELRARRRGGLSVTPGQNRHPHLRDARRAGYPGVAGSGKCGSADGPGLLAERAGAGVAILPMLAGRAGAAWHRQRLFGECGARQESGMLPLTRFL